MGKTHVLVGVSYGVSLLPLAVSGQYSSVEYGVLVCGLVIGSLLPDIDHPHSLISQQIPLIGRFISSITRHRGFFHSILGVLTWFALMTTARSFIAGRPQYQVLDNTDMLISCFSNGLLVGYVLHIVADMMTVSGVKLFYPMNNNIRFGIVKTGGIRELVFRWILIAFCAVNVISLVIR